MTGNAVTRVRAFVNAQKGLEIVTLSQVYQSNDYLHLFTVDLNTLLHACDPTHDDDSTLVQRLKRMRSEWEADGGESGPPTINGRMIGELIFALTDPQPLKDAFHAGKDAAQMAALAQASHPPADGVVEEVKRLSEALKPFAKAGELFDDVAQGDRFDQCIYLPAAGQDYAISASDIRRARSALAAVPIPTPSQADGAGEVERLREALENAQRDLIHIKQRIDRRLYREARVITDTACEHARAALHPSTAGQEEGSRGDA